VAYRILGKRGEYAAYQDAVADAKERARDDGRKQFVIDAASEIVAMVDWDGHVWPYEHGVPVEGRRRARPNSAQKYVVYIHAWGRQRMGATRPPPIFGRAVECKTLKQCDEVSKREMKEIEKDESINTATVRVTRHILPDNPRHTYPIETLEEYKYWDEWERTR
jgi:hypothetical protein